MALISDRWIAPTARSRVLLGVLLLALILEGCRSVTVPERRTDPVKPAPEKPRPEPPAPEKPLAQKPEVKIPDDRSAHNQKVFDAVWVRIRDEYYDPALHGVAWNAAGDRYRPLVLGAGNEKELYGLINAMLALLSDLETRVVTRTEGRVAAHENCCPPGLFHEPVSGHPVVTDVESGSAAEAAGVKPGWLIVSVDGQPFDAKLFDDICSQEREHVLVEFLDQYDRRVSLPIDLKLKAPRPKGEARVLPGGEVYVRLAGCADDQAASVWLEEQCRLHNEAPAFILDLRTCRGGGETEVKTMAGLLFDQGVDLGTVSRGGAQRKVRAQATSSSSHYAGRVVVLIGAGTIGGAEVLAAALKEHGRAVLVGRKTAGRVRGKRPFELPDGGILECTVGDYRTLNGERLERNGVRPDVEVPLEREALLAGEDLDLEAAVGALRTPAGPGK